MTSRALFTALAILAGAVLSSAALAEDFVLSNVVVPGNATDAETPRISIVVRDGIISQMSEGESLNAEGAVVYDADGGYLIGRLELDEPASFLVLPGDPRDNFEYLVDTPRHSRFVFHEGAIQKNLLNTVDWYAPERDGGWFSYNPPPFSIPVSMLNTRKWNHYDTDFTRGVFTAAAILDRNYWLKQNADSEEQVGDLEDFDQGQVRGIRLGLVGVANLGLPVTYTLFLANNAFSRGFDGGDSDEITFFDWRLDVPIDPESSVSVGKQKIPISMSRVASGLGTPTLDERPAVVEAFLPARGIGLTYNFAPSDGRSSYSAGLFNDFVDESGGFSENPTTIAGRATYLPYMADDHRNLLHLGIGARHTRSDETGPFTLGVKPESGSAPNFITQEFVDVTEVSTLSLETAFQWDSFSLLAEYLRTDVESVSLQDPSYDGYYVTANWALSGESRPYNTRNGTFLNYPMYNSTRNGGWGTWEMSARFSHLDMSEGFEGTRTMDILGLGLNWWVTDSFTMGFNYHYITLEEGGLTGTSSSLVFRTLIALQ